jgi:predicted hydrolase (HD superfamily)
MSTHVPDRKEAYELLTKYNKSESLIKHGLTVEAVMRHFAEITGETDIEKWGIIGLVHDLDYDMYPDQHCVKTKEILESEGWPEDYIHAIISHGWKLCIDVEPKEKMEKVLYTIDELSGLITACVLVRPDKNIMNLEVKSVKKKWKQKSFAAGVNREVIEEGAEMLGQDLESIIRETIKGMQSAAKTIGLDGSI